MLNGLPPKPMPMLEVHIEVMTAAEAKETPLQQQQRNDEEPQALLLPFRLGLLSFKNVLIATPCYTPMPMLDVAAALIGDALAVSK